MKTLPPFAAALLLLAGCAHALRPPKLAAPGEPTLKVMSYNVNFGIPGDGATMQAILDGKADVVFLQETTPEWERWLRRNLARRYPHSSFKHCCGAGGLAVLSKHRFEEKDYLAPPPGGWFPGWRVVVDGPLGAVQVLSVHLRPPATESGSFVSGYFQTPPVRERQIQAFHQALDPALPTLVLGDFNESGGGRALAFLKARGFRDGVEEFQGSAHTWRWPLGPFTLRGQLDHVVYDDKLEPLNVRVLNAGNSDHLPILAEFRARSP